MTVDTDLASLELFTDCEEVRVSRFLEALATEDYHPGELLMRQGEQDTFFLIVMEGVVVASRSDDSGSHTVGRAGRGSLLGELALLTQGRHPASVTAETSVRAAVGDEQAFELLLEMPGMHQRLTRIAAQHFAAVSDPVLMKVPDKTEFLVRPLLRTDRDALASAFARQSRESIRRRFFSPRQPSSRLIEYLVDIDYVDHFAWGMSTADSNRGVAEARYVRLADDEQAADVAFDVLDEYQGRGLGTLLLGALATAASNAGIAHFVAEVLYENGPMRGVLDKAGATWSHLEPGVLACSADVSAAECLIEDPLRSELAQTARQVVTAAGLALHVPAR